MIADKLHGWWRKYVALPSPVELGRSTTGALPSREFSADLPDDVYTWENYETEVRKLFPARWAIDRLLLEASIQYATFRRALEWVKGHTTRRRHLLDLGEALKEQPVRHLYGGRVLDLAESEFGLPDKYRYGYIDPGRIMLLASFLALRILVEREKLRDPALDFSPEELQQEPLKSQKVVYDEIMSLYWWWVRGRQEEWAKNQQLYDRTRSFLDRRSPECRAAIDEWLAFERTSVAREHEMLQRLVAVQPHLWT